MKQISGQNNEDCDILAEVDKMTGTAGKAWSICLARQLGLSPEQIERYLVKKE